MTDDPATPPGLTPDEHGCHPVRAWNITFPLSQRADAVELLTRRIRSFVAGVSDGR